MNSGWWACIYAIFFPLAACAPKPVPQWLMQTPQPFRGGKVKPFAHLPQRDKSPVMDVHYAIKRTSLAWPYGNSPSGEGRHPTRLGGAKNSG